MENIDAPPIDMKVVNVIVLGVTMNMDVNIIASIKRQSADNYMDVIHFLTTINLAVAFIETKKKVLT